MPGEQRGLGRLEHRRAVRLAAGVVPAEVDARRRLDPVGALAEVDGVQVLGEDLVLRPLALELVGERRLAQLLEDRAVLLGDAARS